ncbi:ABC transporter substrate-binding protein [Amycolatopsis sp. WAC 01376]|uniref:ABC transporter substrate-binding protein n=1 Tax=Amycolatopsis sp. WAC 01376 TaxID=2203195 RepID=UPI000F78CB35|nr:ABC transporter substrate-binding protein [Amycolatopsis sp. WAC 01376]RSM57386.1 ABC transporter substrate-binding protein [Amycolatopsis sp. WAC 01376]
MRRVLFAVAAIFLIAATAPSAHAVDQSKGYPGFCKDGNGVTVVVDFQRLGGTTIVRCNPQTTRGTGLDAVKGAGFQIAGVQRWGESFVCRIENRPSAAENLPVTGHDKYREQCVDTPPAQAYWSYWNASNNCAWDYSQWGVKNRDFIPGGFEGWSFSLNATTDNNPVPRIAAVRPGTEGRPCVPREEAKPVTGDPGERQRPQPGNGQADGPRPTAGAEPGAGEATAAGPSSGALPPPKPRSSASARPKAKDPSSNVAFTGGENAEDVNAVIERESGASDWAPWAAGGAVLALCVAGFLVARRRKRAQGV